MKNKQSLKIFLISTITIILSVIIITLLCILIFKEKDNTNIYRKSLSAKNWYSYIDDLELSKEEKIVVDYYNNNYILLDNYEYLTNYSDIYKNVNLLTEVSITEIKNNNINANLLTKDLGSYTYDNHPVIIKGDISDDYKEGDILLIYATFLELDSDTKKPVLKINKSFKEDSDGKITKFSNEDLQTMTSYLWNNDAKNRKAILDKDYNIDNNHSSESDFMLAEINKTNTVFRKMELLVDQNIIRSSKSTSEEIKNIYVGLDFEHFIVLEYNQNNLNLNIKYYDNQYNELWSTTYTTNYYPFFDYTLDELYITIDENLYIFNLETGEIINKIEDISKPYGVSFVNDSIVVVDGKIIKNYSKDKELIWRVNLDQVVDEVTSIQNINGDIILEFKYQDDDTLSLIKLDKDGKILGETKKIEKEVVAEKNEYSNINKINVDELTKMINDKKILFYYLLEQLVLIVKIINLF